MLNSNLFFRIEEITRSIICLTVFFIIMKKLGNKYSPKNMITNIINVLFILIFIEINNSRYIDLMYLIIHIILLVLICKLAYSFNWKKSLLYAITYSISYMVIETTLHYIILFIYIYNHDKLFFLRGIYFEICRFIITNLFILIFILCFDKIRDLTTNTKYYLYIGFTLVINILIIIFLSMASNSIYDFYSILSDNKISYDHSMVVMPFVNFADTTLPFIIVISNALLILMLIKFIKITKDKAKIEVMNEKLDMQYNYYLTVKESQEKVRKLHHDINNHMISIKTLKKSNEDVNKYIDSINDEIKDFENTYNTGNIILDIILNEKGSICKNRHIDFMCDINFSKCNFIDMIDVSSIFANILDNAIEACNRIEDEKIKKYINIRGTIVKSYYIVRCENSKINKVIIKNNKVLTNKKDKYLHGIGVQSIKSSLKKYDGELEIKTDEDKFIAVIYIPLK